MINPGSPIVAPGGPGIEPRWTRGAKLAVGTAYSTSSHVWYTLDHGCVTEVYYPTIDSPQIRDLQFLITDGETFFTMNAGTLLVRSTVSEAALGFEVINREKEGRYTIYKTIVGDPHQNCLLVFSEVEAFGPSGTEDQPARRPRSCVVTSFSEVETSRTSSSSRHRLPSRFCQICC